MPERIPPLPPGGPAEARPSDRELIKALRAEIQPAEGDPVDTVSVRDDAAEVFELTRVAGQVTEQAMLVQRTQVAIKQTSDELHELDSALAALPEGEERDAAIERLDALTATILPATSDSPRDSDPVTRVDPARERLASEAAALEARARSLGQAADELNSPDLFGSAEEMAAATATALMITVQSSDALAAQAGSLTPVTAAAIATPTPPTTPGTQ